MKPLGETFLKRPQVLAICVALALLALPLVVWFDLRDITDHSLRRQSLTLNSVITGVRNYYADNVVGRLSQGGSTSASHDYHVTEGNIPIPATLSIELGETINTDDLVVAYRFVSDHPFTHRGDRMLTPDENRALAHFRTSGDREPMFFHDQDTLWNHSITLVTPVIMEETCVACHNAHPLSPKTDWKPGDIRGVQSFQVGQPLAANLLSFKWLLGYMAIVGTAGALFARSQFQQAGRFRDLNAELAGNNEFLAGISMKLSRYLSPQIYRSIFSGEKEVEISTERKKLTVFFSDIKDFTLTAETLQPEELTVLLNEYFTEMSRIAGKHGATIDKFIGDAIVAFFGDPETKGAAEDARACVRMALEMQDRLEELAEIWRGRGIEHPFRARIGINTGYCNVGNFGSDARMDYTIIGAEANLAARLEASAPPGGIVMSYETYALVRDLVEAEPGDPMRFKGIPREVVPYAVKRAPAPKRRDAVRLDGDRVTIELTQLDDETRARLTSLLRGSPEQRDS